MEIDNGSILSAPKHPPPMRLILASLDSVASAADRTQKETKQFAFVGSNPLGDNNLCSPSPSEETITRGPNTPIPTTHALICEEFKDPGIPPKMVP